MSINRINSEQWNTLCGHAFENLPQNTAVTFADVDAILTWCIPEYERMQRDQCVSCMKGRGDCGH